MALPSVSSSFDEVVTQILRPTTISSFKGSYESVRILVFTNASGEPTEELVFDDIFPIHTVADLATRIYTEKELQDSYHPQNQCLLNPQDDGSYIHFNYVIGSGLQVQSPFLAFQGAPDKRFVDMEGNTKQMEIVSMSDMLLENTLFRDKGKDVYTLHLYRYRDILESYSGIRPINRIDWEGKFRVFFPEYPKEQEDGSISEAVNAYTLDHVLRFQERLTVMQQMEQFLQDKPLRKPGETTRGDAVNLSTVRNLRFSWVPARKSPAYKKFQIESVFYDFPVSATVPYIRYYPASQSPVSKIHVEGPLTIPSLERPEILFQWAQERSLTPSEDLIMAKILLRPGSGSVYPLYATLYIFEEGSAKFIVQPSADVKGLSVQADLFNLSPILGSVLASIPPRIPVMKVPRVPHFTPATMSLDDAYIVLNLWLERDDTFAITRKSLDKVLPFFRPFFQVTTSPIKDQHPITCLRYKCVNNFRTPSRDFQFLQRVIDLQKIAGKTSLPDLVKYYRDEFDVPTSVAETRVAAYLGNLTEFSLVDPVTTTFTQTENPGIDIAIFGKDGYYTFHIYRVDSIETLRRIKTLLSLLVSVEPADFEDILPSAKALEEEDIMEEEGANAVQEADTSSQGPSALLEAAALSRVAESLGNEEGAFELDQLGDFAGFGEEEDTGPLAASAPVASTEPSVPLATLVSASDPVSVALPAAASAAQAQAQDDDDDDDDMITDPSLLKTQPSSTYFRKRLQLYDRKLFVYRSTHKSQKKYPSACAGNALKQPAVMSEDEYSRMKEIYEKDEEEGRVQWVEYPIKKGAVEVAPVKKQDKSIVTERVTVLRYGSNLLPGQANIYTCSLYWCRQDEIVILKKDFEATVDRKGRPKDKNTCPFCRGGLVKNRKVFVKGEAVIERATKDKTADGKSHLFIQFLTKNPHPDGLYLPCCFLKEKLITEKDHPAYATLSSMAQKLVASEPSLPTKEDESVPMAANYVLRLNEFRSSYITGAEKLPLEITPDHGPQIGIVPPAIDTLFAQKSVPNLVKLDHTVWKLMTDNRTSLPNVSGFFRIAVENRKRFESESFFAAVAPYFGFTGIVELRRALYDIIKPRLFMGLNYGNFLFDFYDPKTPPPTQNELYAFSKLLGSTTGTGIQKEALIRAWKAYHTFTGFLEDTTKLKESRQFYNVFTVPGLLPRADHTGHIRTNGIAFIIIEVSKGVATIRCPPYGKTPAMAECDVAFIIHYLEDRIWEPLFYTRNDPEQNIFENTMVFTRDTYADWPSIVKTRVAEFDEMCSSSGLGMYTDSQSVNPKTMLPLSIAMDIGDIRCILRDSYNHVSAILYIVNEQYIYVPVIDDGYAFPQDRIELDWRNFIRRLAPANVVEDFYDTSIRPFLTPAAAETYEFTSLMRLDKTLPERDVFMIHLKGGLFVPTRKAEGGGSTVEEVLESEEGHELPWMIDTKLAFGEEVVSSALQVDYKEFEEIYQHLRFTFANWLAMTGGTLKTEINSILYDRNGNPNMNMPIYEKRLRLFIKLGNDILSWIDSSIPQKDRKSSLKRVDCRVVGSKDACSNRCVWKDETSTCLLHIPEKFNVGANEVDAKGLLVRKLIEELVRFPQKRNELLKKRVGEYSILREPFRSGNEYIIPENLPEWTELLRMEWRQKQVEKPKYIEEFSWVREEGKASAPSALPVEAAEEGVAEEEGIEEEGVEEVEAEEEEAEDTIPIANLEAVAMPAELRSYLRDKASFFTFFVERSSNIHPFLEFLGVQLDELESMGDILEYPVIAVEKAISYVSKEIHMSVYQINYEEGNPVPPAPLIAKGMLSPRLKAPYLCIFKLPDGRVGVLSDDPTVFKPVAYESLPSSMKVLIDKAGISAKV